MLHIVHLVERRFPRGAGRIAPMLLALSACALAAGLVLSLSRA